MTDTVEDIINAKFSPMKHPKDEQLERAKESWRSFSKETEAVLLPKVPDNYRDAIRNAPSGSLTQRAYLESYDSTLRFLRDWAGQVGAIDAFTQMSIRAEPPPRDWQKNTEEE